MNKTQDTYKMWNKIQRKINAFMKHVHPWKISQVRIILAIRGIIQLPPTTFLCNLRPRSVEGESLQRDLIRKATYWLHSFPGKGKSKRGMKRSRGRSLKKKKKKKVFHRDWLENFCSSQLVSFERTPRFFTIRSNWPRAMPINVIYQRCNLLRASFSIVWVNSFHRRSRGRLQKKKKNALQRR